MSLETKHPLAIIVPAYKPGFLWAALASIGAQTDQRFQLYIFDDAGPGAISEICREFSAQRAFVFHRFAENLGTRSLAQHWQRCVAQTTEPWIWVFSDDDVMEPGCVAAFHAELARSTGTTELYRFSTHWIDAQGAHLSTSPAHPPQESGVDFLIERLAGRRNTTLQELIFRRTAFAAVGGVPDFPLAWHADEAFAAMLGARQPLRGIAGPRVQWRLSQDNISGQSSPWAINEKVLASTVYFRWAQTYFQQHAPERVAEFAAMSERWLRVFVRGRWAFLNWRTAAALDEAGQKLWRHRRGWGYALVLGLNFSHFFRKVWDRLRFH